MGVTEDLQADIDQMPDCWFAADMVETTQKFGALFNKTAHGDEVQLANINELLMVGQQLQSEGGSGPDPAHSLISGLLCKGSEGRVRFLSAYARCYRREYDLVEQRGSIWRADLWTKAIQDTFTDIGKGVGGLGKGIGEGLGEILKQLLPLIAGIIVLGIVVLVVVNKVEK